MLGAFRSLLIDHRWRFLVGRARYSFFRLTRGLRTVDSPWARKNTVSHNLTAFENLRSDFTMPRMVRLIHAAIALESIGAQSRFLVIGPRTENDLLILQGFGFPDAVGVDLISYSPSIVPGDMHALPFEDAAFDIVLCGWTLSYSDNPALARDEMVRVVKDGGVIAIGLEHSSDCAEKASPRDPRLVDPTTKIDRINTTAQILQLFGSAVDHCYVNIDAPLRSLPPCEIERRTGLASSQCLVVATVKKLA